MAMEAGSIGIWDMFVVKDSPLNPANTFIWSDGFRKLLGYTDETDFPNILSSWKNKIHPEDHDMVINSLEDHLSDRTGGTPWDVNYRIYTKSGDLKFVREFGKAVRDDEGTPVRIIGGLKDLTEMREQFIKLQMTMKAGNIGLWDMTVIDQNDPLNHDAEFLWSSELRELLGFHCEEEFPNIIGSWSDRIHPEDKDYTFNTFTRHLFDRVGQTTFDLEYRLMNSDGGYGHYHFFCNYMRDEVGNPIKVIGGLQDVTREKLQLISIQNHELELEQLQNLIFSSFNVVKMSAEGVITDINDKALRVLKNASKENFIGVSIEEFIGKEEKEEIWEIINKGEVCERIQSMVIAPDKTAYFHRRFIPIIDSDGKLQRALLLSYRDDAEKFRERGEEMEYEMQQFYALVMESCNVIEFSPNGTVVDINDNLLAIWGCDRTEFVGKHYKDLISNKSFNAVWTDMVAGTTHEDMQTMKISSGKSLTFRQHWVPICSKESELLRVLLLAFINHDPDPKPRQIKGTTVTKDMADVGTWEMKVQKGDPLNPDNTFMWSDSFRKLLGYTDETDFPNVLKSWSDKLHPDDKEKTLSALAAHILDRTGKTPFDLEYRLLKKDGEYAQFRISAETTRNKKGNPIKVSGMLHRV